MKYFIITTTFCLYIVAILFILFIDPLSFGAIYFLYALVFVSSLFTTAIFSKRVKRNLLISGGITIFVIMRVNDLGNLLNFFLIIGVIVAIEYFSS